MNPFESIESKINRLLTIAEDRDKWLREKEAAEYLGCSKTTLHRMVKSGSVKKFVDAEGRVRYRKSQLDSVFQEVQ